MSKTQALPLLLLLLTSCLGSFVTGEASEVREIVVQTPLQSYEQPSLRDHNECHEKRQSCLQDCAENESCEGRCPICPELIEEAPLLQGVNDTNYVAPPLPVLNTTNIIRLTNEITNTINHQINLKNVLVQLNSSLVGGRFGLGYSEAGPCCHVVSYVQNCTENQENSPCKERTRQRVCGDRCLARTMFAKVVVQCEPNDPENCYEKVEYAPAHKRKTRKPRHPAEEATGAGCGYPGWPYVPCPAQTSCPSSCLKLTLGNISKHGLPPSCASCYPGYAAPVMAYPMQMWYAAPIAYQPYAPGFPSFPSNPKPAQPEQGEQPDDDDEWNLVAEKCQNSSGELIDCPEGSGDNDDSDIVEAPERQPPAHLENGQPEEEPDYNVPAQRRRRHQNDPHKFIRSLYSHRSSD